MAVLVDVVEILPFVAPFVVAALAVLSAVRLRRARATLRHVASAPSSPGAPCRTDFGAGYDFIVAGRRARMAVAATAFSPTIVIDVIGDVPADDLRRRCRLIAPALAAQVRHVEIVGDRVRVCLQGSIADAAARAVEIVVALERARAGVDAEGPRGGAPIAVRATGG